MDKMDKKLTNIKNKNKKRKRKRKASPEFKFDAKAILKERQKKQQELDELKKKFGLDKNDDLLESKDSDSDSDSDCIIIENPQSNQIDCSNFNIPFNETSDITESCERRLYLMSIEKNQLVARTHFNNLIRSNWSPKLSDVSSIFSNWGIKAETTKNLRLKNHNNIAEHNFELVMTFVEHKILKNNELITTNDVIVISKFAVNISLNNYGAHMVNATKTVFRACIERAFNTEDENSIIQFADQLFIANKEDDILQMIIDLFMPLYGEATTKLYTYVTYKLYMSLLGKTNEGNPFPSNINDWYIQNLVNKDYFNQHPNKAEVLNQVIHLLEHVVVAFDLYQDIEQLSTMFEFFMSFCRTGLSGPYVLINILDQWRLKLFGLKLDKHIRPLFEQ